MINSFNHINRLLVALAVTIFSLMAYAGHSTAATQTSSGITVSPAFQQVTILPDAQQKTLFFSITNNGSVAQSLSLSVADFNALNESGGLFFVGTIPSDLQKKYGLAKWVELPVKNLTVEPKQTAIVEASILNLPELEAGGHYGALMISIDSANSSNFTNKVGLHPIASSLLFVTKSGGDTHKLSLSKVVSNGNLFLLPSETTLSFSNNGNTHLTPRGIVTITDSKNNIVSKGIINEDSKIILPSNSRNYKVNLNRVSSGPSLGKYKLNVNFRFDGFDKYRTYQQSFMHISLPWIMALLAVTALLFFLIYRGASNYRSWNTPPKQKRK